MELTEMSIEIIESEQRLENMDSYRPVGQNSVIFISPAPEGEGKK